MIFFKHSLITLTFLSVAIWVMPVTSDSLSDLQRECYYMMWNFMNVEVKESTVHTNMSLLNSIYKIREIVHRNKAFTPYQASNLIKVENTLLNLRKQIVNDLAGLCKIFCDSKITDVHDYRKNIFIRILNSQEALPSSRQPGSR